VKLHHYNQMMAHLTRRQKFSNGGDALLPKPNPLSPAQRNQKVFSDYVGRMKKYLADGVGMPEWFVKDLIFQKADELGIELKASGGRIGFEEGLLVSDLTPQELVNAQSAARKKGITGKKGSKEFADFVGNGYRRLITKKAQFKAKQALEAEAAAKSLQLSEIDKLAASEAPVKLSYKQRTKLLDSYHQLFEEAYYKRVDSGQKFGQTDLVRDVIEEIEKKYPKQKNNLEFFPGKTKDIADKGKIQVYLEYINPKKKSSSFRIKNSLANTLTANQMDVFEGNVARGLKQTKQQEKIFNALKKGINEMDDLMKATGMNKSTLNHEISKLVNAMFVRSSAQTPVFLQSAEAQNAIGDVYNALVDSETLSKYHTRNIKSMIYDTFPNDPKLRQIATDKVNAFTAFINDLKTKFPGLKIEYDHPASYQALRNLDFKHFLNVTPIMQDINNFKSRFDSQSILNLRAMEDAKTTYGIKSEQYKAALKNQRGLERVWSNMTGGQSTLGKLRLNRQTTGTTGLETVGKNLIQEFKGNIKIRENIAKNIDEKIKFWDPKSNTSKTIFQSLEEVLPTKTGKTKLIESAKRITSPELLEMDKEIAKVIKYAESNGLKLNSFAGAVDLSQAGIKLPPAVKNALDKIIKYGGKTLRGVGKGAVVLDPMFMAYDVSDAFGKGATGAQAAEYGIKRFAEGLLNVPGMVAGGTKYLKDKLTGQGEKAGPFEYLPTKPKYDPNVLPWGEFTFAQDKLKKQLDETPENVKLRRIKDLQFDTTILPNMTMSDVMETASSQEDIDIARHKFLTEQLGENYETTHPTKVKEMEKPEKFGIYADQIKKLEV